MGTLLIKCVNCGRVIMEEKSTRIKGEVIKYRECELDCYTDYIKNEPDRFVSGQK